MCDITGETEGGYDCCLSDVEMIACEKGHEFKYDGFPTVETWINDNGHGDLPVDVCPICNGKAKAQLVERLKNMMNDFNITGEDLK